MSVALGWTILGVMIVGFAAVVTMVRSDIGRLDTKIEALGTKLSADIRGLSQEIHILAERQAKMNGQLDVVVRQAHTHPVG